MHADFNLDFYTEVQDLSYLEHALDRTAGRGKRAERFKALNRTICEMVEDFGLVTFETLAVEDKESMFHLLRLADKAAGYVYAKGYDDSLPQDMGLYEPGTAAATAGLAAQHPPSKTAASAGALFSTADTGSTLGWRGALEVQERWVDHRQEWDEWAAEQRAKQLAAMNKAQPQAQGNK